MDNEQKNPVEELAALIGAIATATNSATQTTLETFRAVFKELRDHADKIQALEDRIAGLEAAILRAEHCTERSDNGLADRIRSLEGDLRDLDRKCSRL